MPVSEADFLWEATGFSPSGTSVVVTHPDAGGTTAGTTVVVLFHATVITAVPAGFASVGGAGAMSAYAKSDVGAGETSWTFTLVGSTSAAWYLVEMDDVALVDPGDGSALGSAGSTADGGTRSTGTVQNAGSSGIAFAVMGVTKVGTTDVQSWSGWTNGFTERVDVAPASGTAGKQVAAAFKLYDTFSSFESTVTLATSAGSANAAGQMVLLRSAEASINAPLVFGSTFGFGTHAGMGNLTTAGQSINPLGSVPAAPTGTWGTQYSVGAFGRDGRTGLDITLSAGNAYILLPLVSAGTLAFGGNVAPVSGSGTVLAAEFATTSGSDLILAYDTATEKFGLVWYNSGGTPGTTSWQTGTSPLGGGHVWVDIRMSVNSSVHHAAWSIETGTGDGSQTSPADETSTVQSGITVQLGVMAVRGTQTSRFQYSDIVYSRYAGAHPLGPHVVRVLAPETTGATVSGTSSNFSKFTANGTLAAWAGDAGALLDDVPPTISASSDGVAQTAVAASDYMNFPMTTYTLASDEIIAGVRAFASLWGGTGSGTGTLGFRGWDGTTETTFVAASVSFDPDSLTTASATYPMWFAAMWGVGSAWTQAKLGAAALRGGFSTDATPDMGFSCMGLEVATRTIAAAVVAHRLTSDEDPEAVAATVTEALHPYSSGVRTYTVSNNDATRTAVFNYSISGTPQTPVTVAPAAAPVDVVVGAEVFGEVDSTSFGWQ